MRRNRNGSARRIPKVTRSAIALAIALTTASTVADAFVTPHNSPRLASPLVVPRSRSPRSLGPRYLPPPKSTANESPSSADKAASKPAETPDALPTDLSDAVSRHHTPLTQAAAVYKSYLTRLWAETDPDKRRKSAREEMTDAVHRVEEILSKEEEQDVEGRGAVPEGIEREPREALRTACKGMLDALGREEDAENEAAEILKDLPSHAPQVVAATTTHPAPLFREEDELATAAELEADAMVSHSSDEDFPSTSKALEVADDSEKAPAEKEGGKKKKKKGRSVLFGATMGALVAGWVFSGNYIYAGLFAAFTVLVQLEYYRMCMGAGVYPARRISIVGACSMYVAALFAPELHQLVLPAFGTAAMIWFLTMRREVSTLPEIATTFTGMFYLGYIPSFWVRLRVLGGNREPTRLAPILSPMLDFLGKTSNSLPRWIPSAVHLPVTSGAIFVFWTWLCIAFSDVGAYFVGRAVGKTKLGEIAPAAGVASPNKTVEGLVGGCAVSAVLATIGAWVQRWPFWYVTGPTHGVLLGLLGLIGDLTASMLKRDAGLKDFGDLIPEHGGIMDRVDSYIFTAPYSWLVAGYVLPWLKGVAGAAGRAAVTAAAV